MIPPSQTLDTPIWKHYWSLELAAAGTLTHKAQHGAPKLSRNAFPLHCVIRVEC